METQAATARDLPDLDDDRIVGRGHRRVLHVHVGVVRRRRRPVELDHEMDPVDRHAPGRHRLVVVFHGDRTLPQTLANADHHDRGRGIGDQGGTIGIKGRVVTGNLREGLVIVAGNTPGTAGWGEEERGI